MTKADENHKEEEVNRLNEETNRLKEDLRKKEVVMEAFEREMKNLKDENEYLLLANSLNKEKNRLKDENTPLKEDLMNREETIEASEMENKSLKDENERLLLANRLNEENCLFLANLLNEEKLLANRLSEENNRLNEENNRLKEDLSNKNFLTETSEMEEINLKEENERLRLSLKKVSKYYKFAQAKCARKPCPNRESHDKEFPRCSQCKVVKYCSGECQRKHWNTSHKKWCVQLNELPPSNTDGGNTHPSSDENIGNFNILYEELKSSLSES